MTKIKICGMMKEEDLDLARRADYLGFVIESGSRRSLTPARARDLMEMSDRKKVAVLTSQDPERIERLMDILNPDVLQLHSIISVEAIQEMRRKLDIPIWALVSMGKGRELERAQKLHPIVNALLLDSCTTVQGGSGIPHDWRLSRALRDEVFPLPVVLSGGLRTENVRSALSQVEPTVVDVSSGVEENGTKNGLLIQQFIETVRGA